ncbi:hypothetical protein GGH93_004121 [Coemansia aciculifera]|nr:hypothetical protein GGH93_004121 [Coemansia aciculifera]
MSEGPKRFSLSDYQSKRGHAKPAEAAVLNDQKTELEELHMLLRTGDLGKAEYTGAEAEADNSGSGKKRGRNVALRTPGASPDDGNGGYEDEEGEDVEMADSKGSSKRDRGSSRRGDKRDSRDRDRDRDSRRRRRSSSRHRHHRHHHKSSRRSKRSRSRSRSPSPAKHRRSKGRSVSPSRSRTRGKSDREESRSRSRTGRSQRSSRKRESRSSRSQSTSRDKISMRCVFPYEDGGIIIGLRGAHLTKLRRAMPDVDWRISNETNDRQDRILVIKGTVKHVSEAFKELAEHFISQGMHVEYPPQTRGRGNEDVDVAKPFVPMRLLIPHKTCGAIIGQKSETLINTRISCGARRVYVYRERIANSRERVVEIVGTPVSIAKVMLVLGEQVARTLTSDQQESDPYSPERDGLRQFLSKQGVPRTRVNLEPIKPPGTAGDKDEEKAESRKSGSAGASSSKRRSADRSMSRSPSSEQSRSRSRSRSRDQERGRRSKHRSSRRARSRSRSVSPLRRSSRRSSKKKDSTKPQSSKREETRYRSRADSRKSVRLAGDSDECTLYFNIAMESQRLPVMCWMQPEAKCRFAVGSEAGLRVFKLGAGLGEDGSTAAAKFESMGFRPMRHCVTSLAAFPREARHMTLIAVGNAAGEVGLQFYPYDEVEGDDAGQTACSQSVVYGASERVSRALEFNSLHSDLLACGFDHREGRSSLIIHDITRGANVRQLLGSASGTNEGVAPRHSRHPSTASSVGGEDSGGSGGGGGAGVTSLCWVPGSADDILVASKRTRSSIRWYDLRERKTRVLYVPISEGMGAAAATGPIYDLQFDPFNNLRYMAHDRRGTAYMWDIRWALRPLHTLALGAQATRVRFSTRRSGIVAAVGGGSSVVSVFSVNEYDDNRTHTATRLTASAFLDDSCAKDRYDEDQTAMSAQPPPASLHMWSERTATSPAGSPAVDLLWVPPAASHASQCRDQLVTCSSTGLLLGRTVPMSRAAALNCRGDVAVATNWRGVYAKTNTELAILHSKVPEVCELTESQSKQQPQGSGTASTVTVPSLGPSTFYPTELSTPTDDILRLMRQLALRGYGMDAGRNAHLTTDAALRDVWLWIRDADIRRNTGSYSIGYGNDISFLGVYDVMRLRRRQLAHLYTLAPIEAGRARQEVSATTRLTGQRQLALTYLGWGLDGPLREQHIRTLETAREYATAAAVSFVYGNHRRCLQSLELSPSSDQKLLSFMFKAQLSDSALLARSFSADADSAPDDMYASPHLQMIFAFLVTGSWHAVIRHMSGLPLSWRLAFALRYFDDAQLMAYLVKTGGDAVQTGSLDGLIVTGISGPGRVLTQNYVDATADVQTAALLTVFDPVTTVEDPAEHWIYSYRHLLNMWRMFTIRCLFDIAHASHRAARGLPPMSKIARDIAVHPADLRCQYCHQSLTSLSSAVVAPTQAPLQTQAQAANANTQSRLLNTFCPKCTNLLPRCIICRMTLGAPIVVHEQQAADITQWFSWCQTCGHGGHAAHVHDWFSTHTECPVPGCECRCERSY